MPFVNVPASEKVYPWQVEQKARIKEAERIGDEVLQRRQYRSFIENDEPLSNSHIILSSHAVDHVPGAGRGKDPCHRTLYVMKKDGSKRPACDIYEWLQQFCVEQCAVVLALAEQMPAFGHYPEEDLPCQLGRADGYKAPQLCMGCAGWWTRHQGQHFPSADEPVFNRLVRDWRRTERPAEIVLAQVHPEGFLLFQLIQPFLQLPPMATHFPCTRAKLGDFIEEISVGEQPSSYRRESNGAEVFVEQDYEDGLLGGYFLSNQPMHFTKPNGDPY